MSMEKSCNFKIVQSLIAERKIYPLTAIVDLTDLNRSLILNVPGFANSKIFTLAQANDVIVSILCREIPYVISDLLCVIKLPVFYKGYLVMEINCQLALLEPTVRSLETDLRYLSIQVSRRKLAALERLFWLRARNSISKFKRKSVWCPAKEAYRTYLKSLIDCKLCQQLVGCVANRQSERLRIFQSFATQRKEKEQIVSCVKFKTPVISSKIFLLSKQKNLSIFNAKCKPSDLIARRKNSYSEDSFPFLKAKEEWLEIYCNDRKVCTNGYKSAVNGSLDSTKVLSLDDGADELPHTSDESAITKRRTAVRIIRDIMGLFWARPILSEAKLSELGSSFLDTSVYVPQPSFLGSLKDCREYLLRLFVSMAVRNTTSFEIFKTLYNDDLIYAFPAQIRRVLCDATASSCMNAKSNKIFNGSVDSQLNEVCANGGGKKEEEEDVGLQFIRCINVRQTKTHVAYVLQIGDDTKATDSVK